MEANKAYKVNSQLRPVGFPHEFDAHIYFEAANVAKATHLRDEAIRMFEGKKVFVGEMIPEAIGPHPTPMFEINFPEEYFSEVVLWLMHERGELSVLVHELTGDDLYDHTQAALWLGKPVELKYDRFK